MNTLVAQLQPQPAFRREAEEDEDYTGYGNLDKNGMITGMALPRVADVSVACWVVNMPVSWPRELCFSFECMRTGRRGGFAAHTSQHRSSLPTPTPSPPTPKAESSSRTERPLSLSSSKGVLSSLSTRGQQQGAISVC
jgi:hypothetical protein